MKAAYESMMREVLDKPAEHKGFLLQSGAEDTAVGVAMKVTLRRILQS